MSVVLFRYFHCFSLFWAFYATTVLPFIRRSQGCTLGFRPFPTRRPFAPRKSIRSKFFRPQLRLYDPCTRTNVSSSKILAHYAVNEHFPPPIPRSLLSLAPCDILTGHGCGRGLGQRSNFTLSTVVQSINVHYLPHPLSELSLCSIVPINQWHGEVMRREINNGHDLNIILRVLTSTTASTTMLSKVKRPGEFDNESNPKRLKSGKGSSFVSQWKFW